MVVNYNTGAFAEVAIASLRVEWRREGRHMDDLEIVLVDNNSPIDQEEFLARIEATGVTVLRSPENLGYAGGMNLAFAETSGEGSDIVALLNPDLYFLPGSIAALMDYVADNPDVGAADPRTFFDPGKRLQLPRNLLPTLYEHAFANLSLRFPPVLRAYSRRRQRLAAQWWTSAEPIDADMLSGCCVFLRREVITRLGFLMDDRFPLYFEDTDLFRRIARLGLRVVHQVRAEVLHHWSRSSGIGAAFEGEPRRRQLLAETAYFKKYYGALGARVAGWITKKGMEWGARGGSRLHECRELGPVADPPRLEFGRHCAYVMEVGLAPSWLLSAGMVGEGSEWTCPMDTWEWWFEGRYFLRVIDLETREVLGAWSFLKCVHGRNDPLPNPELAEGVHVEGQR